MSTRSDYTYAADVVRGMWLGQTFGDVLGAYADAAEIDRSKIDEVFRHALPLVAKVRDRWEALLDNHSRGTAAMLTSDVATLLGVSHEELSFSVARKHGHLVGRPS